jgi:hypothetical protein
LSASVSFMSPDRFGCATGMHRQCHATPAWAMVGTLCGHDGANETIPVADAETISLGASVEKEKGPGSIVADDSYSPILCECDVIQTTRHREVQPSYIA